MELEQTIQDWGAPECAIRAVAEWIRSGGDLYGSHFARQPGWSLQ